MLFNFLLCFKPQVTNIIGYLSTKKCQDLHILWYFFEPKCRRIREKKKKSCNFNHKIQWVLVLEKIIIIHLKASNGIQMKNGRPWLKTIFRLLLGQQFIWLLHRLISISFEFVKVGSTLSVFYPLSVKL